MKWLFSMGLVLVLLLSFCEAVGAQSGSLPENPTDIVGVLLWLAGGGAGAFVAVWIERQGWFQRVPPEYKRAVVMAAIALVALIPQVVMDVMPAAVWEAVGPYFSTVVAAILLGYPASQVLHVAVNKRASLI